MNIHKLFTRLAAGLTLGFGINLSANTQVGNTPLVPSGQNPPYLGEIYNKLATGSVMSDPASYRIRTSITSLTDIPDDPWLRQLQNMSAAEAEEEVRSCLESLCAHKYPLLDQTDKFIANIMVLEALFHNGLNQQEFRIYSEFLKNFEADENFKARDEQVMAIVVKEIYDSEEYRNIREKIIPTAQVSLNNAEQQFHLRRNFMKYVSDHIRAAFGYAPLPIYLDVFPASNANTLAVILPPSYVQGAPQQQFILANYKDIAVDNPENIISYMAHETRHGVDFTTRDALKNREFDKYDPRFSHTATIILNENAVVQPCAANTPPPSQCTEQYQWYRHQYRERSAFDFGNKFLERFRQEIKNLEQASKPIETSSRLEPQKLQLPS